MFRGQSSAKWPLETLLDRYKRLFGGRGADAAEIEEGLLREFQRKAHLYRDDLPPCNRDMIEWLALMQHYGAPTRLLDWTYSFHVALFFALKDATRESAVFGIDVSRLRTCMRIILPREKDEPNKTVLEDDRYLRRRNTFKKVFQSQLSGVMPQSAFRLNDRAVIQQGLFLIPCNVRNSFLANLAAASKLSDDRRPILKKFVIHPRVRNGALRVLHRMNLNEAVLFPGLDGFARSLRTTILWMAIYRSRPADWP